MTGEVQQLIEGKQYAAGIDLLAQQIGLREGIWWGCLCFQHAVGERMTEMEKSACRAVVQWIAQPNDQLRAAATQALQATGIGNCAGMLVSAVSQNGMPPARAIGNAVKLASTKSEPARLLETQRLYLELGIGVAEGRFPLPVFKRRTTTEKWDWEISPDEVQSGDAGNASR
jgi:hypothetical protein